MSTRSLRIDARRTATAQRDLDWTGERMLPWTDDPAIAYEHLHRYAFAAQLAAGRRVLDMGCGEGYGSALLAAHAGSVLGIDVDERAVEHAAASYTGPNIGFAAASVDDLGAYTDGSFDLVVCFEVIEHVVEQRRVIAEARRLLGDGGLFICSTPDRDAYRERTGEQNPFHVHELDAGEFRDLLASEFSNVDLWAQRTLTGSLLEPLADDRAPATAWWIERDGGYWDFGEPPDPLYLVAVASEAAAPAPGLSVLADPALLLHEQPRVRAETAERALHEARVERAEAEERLLGYRAGMERREDEVLEMVEVADGLRAKLRTTAEHAARLERRVAEVENSVSWRALESLRARTRRADGTPNAAGRAAAALMGAIARLMAQRRGGNGP